MAWRRVQDEIRTPGQGVAVMVPRSRLTSLLLGSVIALATGIVLVKAGDNPGIREVFIEFNKPIRRAVQAYAPQVQMPKIQVPQIFRRTEGQRSLAVSPAPAPRYQPSTREENSSVSGLPTTPVDLRPQDGFAPLDRPRLPRVPKVAKNLTSPEPGLETATNYCVRLCDGYAFPIGRAGVGDEGAQEAACRLGCPGSEVALYSMPRGAKDLSEATRGGAPYTALPTAFRYREEYSRSCTCRAPGQTQSTAALLTDFTLRRGDLAMTRIGMRHFDGSSRFPIRENAFSDALRHIKDPKEARRVRGMEAASLRGNLPVEAHARVRERIANEIRQAEARVAPYAEQPRRVSEVPKGPRRFEEINGRPGAIPVSVRVIESRQRLVALN